MQNFADKLIESIHKKGNPCVVGLDPRLELMPRFIVDAARRQFNDADRIVRFCIAEYHRRIIGLIAEMVPAVKPQSAFFEQYGIPGMLALADTMEEAKRAGLVTILDAKRNDISSTARAYANALMGRTSILGELRPILDADCITVSPYLGRDSLDPFVQVCREYGKGVFVLVKTSNPGSADLQDLDVTANGRTAPLYVRVAEMVRECGASLTGKNGYSSVGAVVGATFPSEAETLRDVMPQSVILAPGYGAQGGKAEDVARCFNRDGLGAVVNSSRGITYNFESLDITEEEFNRLLPERVRAMAEDINAALKERKTADA
jgi:orotidine-5'-phosphate decarboxylase